MYVCDVTYVCMYAPSWLLNLLQMEGQIYCSTYNQRSFPHIAILHPYTKAKVRMSLFPISISFILSYYSYMHTQIKMWQDIKPTHVFTCKYANTQTRVDCEHCEHCFVSLASSHRSKRRSAPSKAEATTNKTRAELASNTPSLVPHDFEWLR